MAKQKNNKKTIRILWAIFIVVLIATLIAEKWMHPHAVFGIEGTPLFNAWFGFASCAAIVVVSKFIGIFVKRKEGYYKEAKNDK